MTTVAVCLLAAPLARARQGPDEVVSVNSRLVQTDVMVFDRDGKFVDGLKPEQFELKVDGRPQAVLFFERVEAGTVNEDAQLAAARGLSRPAAPGARGALPLDRGRALIFFADDLHMSAASAHQIRRTLLRFVDEEVGQNDEAMVASATGTIGFLQQFTDEKVVLRAAVGRISPRPSKSFDLERPVMTEAQALAIDRGEQQVLDYFIDAVLRDMPMLRRDAAEQMVRARSGSMLRQTGFVAVNTLASLESVVRSSAPVPGRKVLFFISDGFIVNPRDGAVRDRLRRVADAAARAGVVIYSLDAQGLRTGQPGADTEVAFDPSGRLMATQMGEVSSQQSPLYELAAETGGRALLNTNTLNRAVAGALKETARYYLLAWRPEEEGERASPKYRRVEVSVKGRPELRVIVRRGFLTAPPPPDPQPKPEKNEKKQRGDAAAEAAAPKDEVGRELRAAIQAGVPRAGIPTTLSLGYISAPNKSVVLSASVELDVETASKEKGGAAERTEVDTAAVVIDDRGKVLKGMQQEWTVTPTSAGGPTRKNFAFTYNFELPPGLYQVRVAARSRRDGQTGSAVQWAELPDVAKGGLALSSIFLGERASSERLPEAKAGAPVENVALSVGRRFARTSWLRFATYIYNASHAPAAPDLTLQVQLFRDDQPVFTAPLVKVKHEGLQDLSRIPYAAELPLSSFPSGRYVLHITAIDRATKTLASQRTRFDIE